MLKGIGKKSAEGGVLTESQLAALERAKLEKEAYGETETEYPGYLVAQYTYYVGNIKGVGRIYQQAVVDTYSCVAFAKLYDRKNALVAAEVLNDSVIPLFDEHDIPLLRMLIDHSTEYCGKREYHKYQLYLNIEDIDHSKTRSRSPQSNGICECLNKTMQDEFYAVAFRKQLYKSIDELQADMDNWVNWYNTERIRCGKYRYVKPPMQTFKDTALGERKNLNNNLQKTIKENTDTC